MRTTMPADRKSRLEALPGWTWDARDEKWEEGFALLEAYAADKGHCRVPQDHVTGDDYRLGQWVSHQRATRTTMPADRKSRLEALPGWTWEPRDAQWDEGFARLEAYVAGKGNCLVPHDHKAIDGYRLGRWVIKQRTKREIMTADRRTRLEALPGWTWKAKETLWEEGFARLEAYVADTGHCRVPQSYVTSDDSKLGQWVTGQRAKQTTMSAARKNRLEALPGWTWDARPTSRGAVKNAEDDGETS
jgi:hypothetical protein